MGEVIEELLQDEYIDMISETYWLQQRHGICVLQCVAVCCSVLQCVAIQLLKGEHINMICETYWLQQQYGICVL